jgi:hypothetical protein
MDISKDELSRPVGFVSAKKKLLSRVAGGLTAGVLAVTCITSMVAQQKAKIPGTDWIQLFNETDLTGWTKIGAESWTVEPDGVLHGRGLTKAYGYLETEKDYRISSYPFALSVWAMVTAASSFTQVSSQTRSILRKASNLKLIAP